MRKNISRIKVFSMMISLVLVSSLYGQHRGDLFTFQGLTTMNDNGVQAMAMGSAVTSLSGDVSMLFYNPAGLANIKGIQATASVNVSNSSWQENQNYRPNRLFVHLPFYLEGLYTPDPAQDGMYDYERLWTEEYLIDSSYIVRPPELGLDPYSDEAADWKETERSFSFNNIAIAIPLDFSGHEFTISGAYNNILNIDDFDRNETYLDPHVGFDAYGEIGRTNGNDTLIMNWSNFYRKSSGKMDNVALGISYKVSKIINVGVGMNLSWGSSDDLIYLERIGTFHLIRQQRFRYWYTDVYDEIRGSSDYSTTRFNLGFQLDLEKFKVGIKVDLPYTLKKEWDYTFTETDSISNNVSSSKGTDQFEVPYIYNFGFSYAPADNFIFSVDYEYAPYSKATMEFGAADSAYNPITDRHTDLPDRHTIRIGALYTPIELISIMAGYRDTPSTYIPDGAAIQTSGPTSKSYTCGLSFNTDYGRLDLAYEYRLLKYYDSYYSNTNYNTNTYTNFMVGYTIEL